MKIKNAKIKNVTMKLDNKEHLVVNAEFHESVDFVLYTFKLNNPVAVKHFIKLMGYAEVTYLNELEGKIIRVAEHENVVRAFGHPIEDRFIDITDAIIDSAKEVTESELLKEYPET